MWDNRCTIHRVIPGTYKANSRRGVRTTVFGEKRTLWFLILQLLTSANHSFLAYFDPASESRNERARRLEKSDADVKSQEGANEVGISA